MKVAITTTVKDAEPHLDTFISYHLSIGFDFLFLFFDDPNDPSANKYLNRQNIIVIRNDENLKRKWEKLRLYSYFRKFVDHEVMARQLLNVHIALKMASAMNIDWILHIDVDELFYSPEQSIAEHFSQLSFNKIDAINYLNHEAIVETMHVMNCFKEVKLFKKNYAILNDSQKIAIEPYNKENNYYFNFYDNGKSAASVGRDIFPVSVHNFALKRKFIDFLHLSPRKQLVGHKKIFPCILHYPCCGFDFFWRKYKMLGEFGDKWFNQGKEIKDILPLHIASREACKSNNIEDAMNFYKENYLEKPLRFLEMFKQNDICFEVKNLFD